ncbi:MAG TPA: EAL domain-containing protein [Acidimicrobiales bacterium]|nr:EAL domain-containing protein [Acidimicrobiales bacterium]
MITDSLPLEAVEPVRGRAGLLRRKADLAPLPVLVAPVPQQRDTLKRFRVAAIATALVFGLFEAWMALRLGGVGVTGDVDNIGELAAALLAAGACAYGLSRRAPELRQPFRLLGCAALVWAVGQAIWSYQAVFRGNELPFPSASDVFYLTASALILVGVAALGRSELGRILRLRLVLDGVIVAASIVAITWSVVLDSALDGRPNGFSEAISLAYPLFDVVTASVAVALLVQRRRKDRVRIALVVAGIFGFVVSDTSFVYATQIRPSAFSGVTDGGWVAGFLLVGLAALWPAQAEEAPPMRAHPWWQLALPYLLLLGAVGAGIGQSVDLGRVDAIVAVSCLVAVLSVLSRQVVILVENARLATRLQRAVTALRDEEAELAHLAKHDPLTGLANRLLFAECLEATLRAPREGRHVAVLFCDLDSFKDVNDSLGHSAGDAVLVEVAARLSACVRPADSVARIGGDEFAVVLDDLALPEDAARAAARIVETMRQPITVDHEQFSIGASVGVAARSTPALDLEALLREADISLYAAKASGGGGFRVYDPELGLGHRERLRTQAELALASTRDELRLEFQPIFDLATGRALGAEALVRWAHPARGLLEPLDFLETAERSGAIVSIGSWVLQRALQQLAAWRRDGVVDDRFFVAVNLSARQMQGAGIVENVERALSQSGVDGSALRLELTESALFDGADEMLELLGRLKALGVLLEIDDFGTGYASLGYLKRLPVDGVKVDQSFVAGLSEDAYDREIVASVIHLAHALGMEVIAEGVETADQLRRLRALGCDCVQGFLLSRPHPADGLAPAIARLPLLS